MWCFNPNIVLIFKNKQKILMLLSFCFLLTACELRPLHMTGERGAICYPIKIATISDRNGQILRNHLIDLLTPGGQTSRPKYILEVKLTEAVAGTVLSITETTIRKKVTVTAVIALKDSKNKLVYNCVASSFNSFPVLSQNYYGGTVADEFAKKETLRNLAEKVALLVAAYLDTHCGGKG